MTDNDLQAMRDKIDEYSQLKEEYKSYGAVIRSLSNSFSLVYFGVGSPEDAECVRLTKAQRNKLIALIIEFQEDIKRTMDNL